MINIIFKNNKIIRILIIELLNSVLMINSLLKMTDVVPSKFQCLVQCAVS
jgi:hypothetical protein